MSSQRVGAWLAVIAAVQDGHPRTSEAAAKLTRELLAKPVAITPDLAGNVWDYVQGQHLWERYRGLRGGTNHDLAGKHIEVQDAWLSDPALPAASGAITDKVADEPVLLAAGLKLVRDKNHTLTDRGRALALAGRAQLGGLTSADLASNPFIITPGVRVIALHALVDADFDFLQAFYSGLIERDGRTQFSRMEVAMGLGETCQALRVLWAKRARTAADRERVRRLAALAKTIPKAKESKTWGGGRTPDQLATVRLEPLVDLGLLRRRDRFKYEYELDSANPFFRHLLAATSAEAFLESELVRSLTAAWGTSHSRATSDEVWERIVAAHAELKTGMGYASARELVLLAIARGLDDGSTYFEVGEGLDVIRDKQKQDPRRIRYGGARGGGMSYVKIGSSGRTWNG
ncbi:hypothetical protein GCM10027053_48020 [Intrasporangium mesophilum]